MAIPLMRLLDQFANDPAQREAFADNPAGALADAGWDDLDDAEVGDIVSAWAGATPGSAPSLATIDGESGEIAAFATTPIDVQSVPPVEAGSVPPTSYDHAPTLEPIDGLDAGYLDTDDLNTVDPDPSQAAATPDDGAQSESDVGLDDAFGTGLDGAADDESFSEPTAFEEVEPLEEPASFEESVSLDDSDGSNGVAEDPSLDGDLFDHDLTDPTDGLSDIDDTEFGGDATPDAPDTGWEAELDG